MIRDICKDEAFLAQKSQPATLDDLSVGQDLLDTLAHHKEECVGMAANMIGVNKRIIVFDLPVPHRHPARQAVELHQGTVAERKVSRAGQDLHRLDGPDHPARVRPLSGDCDIGNRQALS